MREIYLVKEKIKRRTANYNLLKYKILEYKNENKNITFEINSLQLVDFTIQS